MNKALRMVLVVALVAGVFVQSGDALLRAGREEVGKLERGVDPYKRQMDSMNEQPHVYYRRGRIRRAAGNIG